MAKRSRINEKQSEPRLKPGWGDVDAESYRPFLLIHDFSSQGRVSRIKYKGREIHTMSDLETTVLSELLWSDDVIDIRDQVALGKKEAAPEVKGKQVNRLVTERIAEQLGVRHPIMVRDGKPAVMTTDLVAKFEGGQVIAYSIKPVEAISSHSGTSDRKIRRTIEKLEIERRYWTEQGTPWFLVTNADVCKVRKMNIELLLATPPPQLSHHEAYWLDRLSQTIDAISYNEQMTIATIAQQLASAWLVSPSLIIENVRRLCLHRFLEFDMSTPFSHSMLAGCFKPGALLQEAQTQKRRRKAA